MCQSQVVIIETFASFPGRCSQMSSEPRTTHDDATPGPSTPRQTAILDSEEDSEDVVMEQDVCDEQDEHEHRDDAMSVASSTGSASSSVVGRWWTGKDTRDEIVRLTARIKELEKAANVPHTDSETMTDAVQHAPPVSQSPTTLDPVDPNQRTGA
ncbi:hypothetical protein TELCIR_04999 [Teladorsagia circumcincta]|uniref:Uncharacterized protein n=1 Tax=Teladorsagia circumcincta TaxID=45464 RepID=A0A2G9US09_TELCI|nr:hypothetical protein TELCIR_04999 [Teladorsagia circumcincta]